MKVVFSICIFVILSSQSEGKDDQIEFPPPKDSGSKHDYLEVKSVNHSNGNQEKELCVNCSKEVFPKALDKEFSSEDSNTSSSRKPLNELETSFSNPFKTGKKIEDSSATPQGSNSPSSERPDLSLETSTESMINETTFSPSTSVCFKELPGCCDYIYLGDGPEIKRCGVVNKIDFYKQYEDMAEQIKVISCFAECVYKAKKYIRKGNTVNMKMVKKDANKLFQNNLKQRAFYIEMVEHCRRKARTQVHLVKLNSIGLEILKNSCRPYFFFIFMCQANYHKEIGCPYFKWHTEAKNESDLLLINEENLCRSSRNKCEEVFGPSKDFKDYFLEYESVDENLKYLSPELKKGLP